MLLTGPREGQCRRAAQGGRRRGARDIARPGPRNLPAVARGEGSAALRSSRRRARRPSPSAVDADGIGRYSQDVEAAVYFSVLEALQNVQKYAQASQARCVAGRGRRAEVRGYRRRQGLRRRPTAQGSGLTNMADRVDALGGEVRSTSAPVAVRRCRIAAGCRRRCRHEPAACARDSPPRPSPGCWLPLGGDVRGLRRSVDRRYPTAFSPTETTLTGCWVFPLVSSSVIGALIAIRRPATRWWAVPAVRGGDRGQPGRWACRRRCSRSAHLTAGQIPGAPLRDLRCADLSRARSALRHPAASSPTAGFHPGAGDGSWCPVWH